MPNELRRETAEALATLRPFGRSVYICPLIMNSFAKGRVIDRHFLSVTELMAYRGTSLHPAEKSLIKFEAISTRMVRL